MSNVRFDIYLQRENLHFGAKEGITLDELASVLSSFFECEENWYKMKECWLENRKSKDFRRLMKEALLGVYDSLCASYNAG